MASLRERISKLKRERCDLVGQYLQFVINQSNIIDTTENVYLGKQESGRLGIEYRFSAVIKLIVKVSKYRWSKYLNTSRLRRIDKEIVKLEKRYFDNPEK
jgi:hypothetical protein